MSNRFMALSALALALAATLVAAPAAAQQTQARVRVAVTVPLFAPLVESIGAPYVEVDQVIPPGVDPHTYSPPASVIARLDSYDLIVMSGPHHMKVEESIVAARLEGALRHPLILYYRNYTAAGLRLLDINGHTNPHGYWWGPKSLAVIASSIGDALARIDPAHAAWYRARASLYAAKARALEGSLRGLRVAAYSPIVQYFVEESGGELVYTAAPSPGAEPSATAVSEVVKLYREGRVDVFVATRIDVLYSRAAARIVEDLRARGVPAVILPLGQPGADPLLTMEESVGILQSIQATGAPQAGARGACPGGSLGGWGLAVASFAAGVVVMAAWVRRA
ncbi:MAG: zinc ABC transporter substrate-binding protein [Desulfurococcales archaeon]|nr:zinc ABC transporter substrate-binding protein [Desulfurococcales archaeon]